MHAASNLRDVAARLASRGRRAVALAFGVGAALGAAAAPAQAPVSHYGGGAIIDPPKSIEGPGNMIISLRAAGNGKVQIFIGMGARCEIAAIRTTATLAADGSFSASGAAIERPGGGVRLRSTYKVSGILGAANASGTASARGKVQQRGRQTRRCKTGSVAWEARRPTGDVGTPGAALPAARLYGTTSQTSRDRRHALVLRISADGKRLRRALYSLNLTCAGDTLVVADAPDGNLSIGADGKVSDVQHDSEKVDRRTRVRTTETFNATIGAAGATGRFSVTARVIDIPSGRTVGRCRSDTVKFTAGY